MTNRLSSAIAKHYKNVHLTIPQDLLKSFEVLNYKKCRNKFDCLVCEMLFITILQLNLKYSVVLGLGQTSNLRALSICQNWPAGPVS